MKLLTSALLAIAVCLAPPARASACCLSTSVVGTGRLSIWEDAAAGINTGWSRGLGRWDPAGAYRARPAGTSEDELRAEVWGILRLWEPLQLSARVPLVLGVRSSGPEQAVGGGLGDVQAALRWEALAVGEYAGVPGVALVLIAVAPTGRRPEEATDALGASATGRGALSGGVGLSLEYAHLPWFVRLDVGGTLSAPLVRADTGVSQQFGPGLQLSLSGGGELFGSDRLVGALALRLEHEAALRSAGVRMSGTESTLISATASAAYKLTPHWQLTAAVSSDVPGRLGLTTNRDERLGVTLGVRHGFF